MTDQQAPAPRPVEQAPLRVIASMAGRPLDDVYRLFRLEGAPAPVAHVACVPVYDVGAALEHLGVAV